MIVAADPVDPDDPDDFPAVIADSDGGGAELLEQPPIETYEDEAAQQQVSTRSVRPAPHIYSAADLNDMTFPENSLERTLRLRDEGYALLNDDLAHSIEAGTEWATRAPDEEPSIIPGVLIAGGLGVVSGPPKCGKSWWLFALALAVANGVPLLGTHHVERAGDVLCILTEGNHRRTKGRFLSLARGHGLDPGEALSRIDFIWRQGIRLDDPDVLDALARRAPRYSLIVIDLTRHVWRGKSTDDGEVEGYLAGLRQITSLGPTIVNCLHTAKAPAEGTSQRTDGERILGSQLWFGGADSLIYINKPKGSRVARVTFEARDDLSHLPMLMTLPDALVDGRAPTTLDYRSADGQTANTAGLTDEVARRVRENPGLTKSTMATLVSARKADVLAAIDLLCNSGTIYYDGVKHGLFPSSFPQVQEPLGTAEPEGQVVRVPTLKGGNAELPTEPTTTGDPAAMAGHLTTTGVTA